MTKLTWRQVLGIEKQQDYFQKIMAFVAAERNSGKKVYPPAEEVFNAFRFTEFNQVKVLILGQDPYHGAGQANGLAFSVNYGVRTPPSLVNIYKELQNDIPNFQLPKHGCLIDWAKQGVLLLNTVLTVEEGKAHSHATQGWEIFTDRVISAINNELSGVVFLLWGAHAQKKAQYVDRQRHYILTSVHPSPLSAHRGFLGCQHFSKANHYLIEQGVDPIDWQPQPME